MEDVSFDFSEKTVVITGASSGIGREIALLFADSGATVLNADIDDHPDHVDIPTHEIIAENGGSAEYVETDVTDPHEIKSLIDQARDYNGVDIMVNNAGVNVRKSVLEVTPEEYEFVSGVNFRGVLFGCQYAADDMIERDKEGCIVNVASIRTDTALDSQIMYNSTKGAVKMITRSAALDLAKSNIRVNAISPGRTVTSIADITRDAEEMSETSDLVKPIPVGRPAQPNEIAPTVLYLASDGGDYMTGEVVTVDGGWSIYYAQVKYSQVN